MNDFLSYNEIDFPPYTGYNFPLKRPVVVDPELSKFGAAADAQVTGNILKTKLDGEAVLSDSIQLSEDKVQITNYNVAEENQIPFKNSDSGIAWKTLSDVAISGSYEDLTDEPKNVSYFINDKNYISNDDFDITYYKNKISTMDNEIQTLKELVENLKEEIVGIDEKYKKLL